MSHPSPQRLVASPLAARLAAALVSAFLILLGLLHVVEPEFAPSHRLISEYSLGPHGWLMRLAFFSLGGGVLALTAALRPALARTPTAGLMVIGVALIGAGIFNTEPLTDPHETPAHQIHRVCGALVILGFPIVATMVARGLARAPQWASARGLVVGVTVLAWLGLVGFLGAVQLLGRPPEAAVGVPNRLMMIADSLWLVTVARSVISTAPRPDQNACSVCR